MTNTHFLPVRIHDVVRDKVFFPLLIIFPAVFPFPIRITTIVALLLFATWFALNPFGKIKLALKDRTIQLFVLILFVLPVLTVLYSANKNFSSIEKRLWLLMIPLLIYCTEINARQVKQILFSFVIGCTIASAYAFTKALQDPGLLMTSEMTSYTLNITHVYFGMYLCLCAVIIVYYLLTEKHQPAISSLMVLWMAFLLMILFIMAPRMSIIALFFLGIGWFILFIVKTRKWKTGMLMLIFPIILLSVVLLMFPNTLSRFLFMFNAENYQVGDNFWNNMGSRLSILKCVGEAFNTNPLIGTGIGDVQNDLDKCNESLYPTLIGMNPHNQFLQILLGTGIIGLLAYVFFVIYSILKGFKPEKELYLSFLVIFLMCTLTESMLERQQGLVFFSFFYCLLLFHQKREGAAV